MNTLFISKPYCWAPNVTSPQEWIEWKNGIRKISSSEESPALAFTTPLFRRRLSQLSKMTIQVVHEAVEAQSFTKTKQVFVSLRGEIKREFSINEKLIVDKEVSPSAFSLSVFNAPIALAAIACQLKAGYSVIFPSGNDFSSALQAGCAPVLCGDEESILFVYADELIPECYGKISPLENEPFAFAMIVSSTKKDDSYREFSLQDFPKCSPSEFLRSIL